MGQIKCERQGCNNKFEQVVPWKIYCSGKCKQLAWLLRVLKREAVK